ncbi:MAG: YabP/YqfC family sporulation protein [Bacilli bacterium]
MKLVDRLGDYLYDNEYKIIVKKNQVDIVNYDEIIDFSLNKISVKYRNKIFVIEGTNMVISKMLDNEILITGNISSLRIN